MKKTAKEIQEDLRVLINLKMKDFRESNYKEMMKHKASGVIQAAFWADAISEEEQEKLLNELEGKKETCEG